MKKHKLIILIVALMVALTVTGIGTAVSNSGENQGTPESSTITIETTAPETTGVDTTIFETEPETTVPETTVPETEPETTVPETTVHETEVATKAPETTKAPGTTSPLRVEPSETLVSGNMTEEERTKVEQNKKSCPYCGEPRSRKHYSPIEDAPCRHCGEIVEGGTCHDCGN